MKNRKIKDIVAFDSFNNEFRRKIFELCKTPRSFTELKKELSISAGALTHHLKVLESEELITKEVVKKDNKFVVGREIRISSNLKTLDKFRERSLDVTNAFALNEPFPIERQIDLLNFVKSKQPISKNDFKKEMMKNGFSIMEEVFLLTKFYYSGYINETLSLSKEGEQFLKEHSKPHQK